MRYTLYHLHTSQNISDIFWYRFSNIVFTSSISVVERLKFDTTYMINCNFWFNFQVNLWFHYFRDFQKKVPLYASCDCKLYGPLLDFIKFFVFFIYIICEYSCLKYCNFTKLSQIVSLINVHIWKYQCAKYECRFSDVIALFFVFFCIYYNMFETFYLHQTFTNCVSSQKYRDQK